MASILNTKPVLFIRAILEVFSLLVIRLPIWVLLAVPRSNRPRPSWSLGRTLTLRVLQRVCAVSGTLKVLTTEPDYRALKIGKGVKGVWVPAVPQLIAGDVKKWAEEANVESINIPAYWLEKETEDIPTNAPPLEGEKVLYTLHGGAYAMQSAHPNELAACIPRGLLKHAGPSVHRSFCLEYRNSKSPTESPSNPFPAALLDAIAGYVYLVNEVGFASENIIVVGDSAGGNLALALTRYLKDNQNLDGIPAAPGALVLLSPWVDLHPDPTDRTSSFYTNANTDMLSDLVDPEGHAVLNFLGPHGKGAAVTNPYISPASTAQTMPPVSFEGYPRTFILSGATEIFLDQIRVLYDRMKASHGSDVRYVEVPEVWHDFIVFSLEPQSTEALNIIGGWMEE